MLDIRRIEAPFTPRDEFFTLQHYGQPEVDPAAYRLSVAGLVDDPFTLSLDEIRKMGTTELVAGFECSGNGPGRVHGLASNGRWTGVPLRTLLTRAGVKTDADEVVFFGADRGEEDVDFRGKLIKVTQQFGRSLSVADATRPEPFVAHALNGEPLSRQQGFPVRLIVPGWYGVANVKWLSEIHVQHGRYLGKFQARWYRTLRGETINGEVKWTEADISRQHLKSVIARVTRAGDHHRVTGFVLNDGTPLKIGRGARRRRPVASGHARRRQHALLVEAVHVPLGRRDAWRSHAGVPRHRRDGQRAADHGRARVEAHVSREQRAVAAQDRHQLATYNSQRTNKPS